VWLWVKQYNTFGPIGLNRQGRGGRNWAYMPPERERKILRTILQEFPGKSPPKTRYVKLLVEQVLGRKVSSSYIYKMLKRNHWPDIEPVSTRPEEAEYTFRELTRPWQNR
jgi:hypothetical protein